MSLGQVFLLLTTVPLVFLIYTLTHLKKLNIPVFHPRVLVELFFVVLFVVLGIVL